MYVIKIRTNVCVFLNSAVLQEFRVDLRVSGSIEFLVGVCEIVWFGVCEEEGIISRRVCEPNVVVSLLKCVGSFKDILFESESLLG